VDEAADAAFSEFTAGCSRRLLHAADLLTGNRAQAEDLVQHALARTYLRWDSVRLRDPEAYVRRAILNAYLDWWRRLRWRELPLLDGDADTGGSYADTVAAGAGDHADAVATRESVLAALSELTRKERAVVVLRYWLDLSEAQIAAELRIAPGTVKSTAARALARLRRSPHLTEQAVDLHLVPGGAL
jgi:RNA polymerase sigma-70 factor (sigma-E family)